MTGEPMVPDRAVILSGSIGRGHTVVAEVCAAALQQAGFRTTIHDCMALLGPVEARVAEAFYRLLISRPALYDGFHFAHLRAEGRFSRGGDEAAAKRIVRALDREHHLDRVAELDEVALVLSVFATGAPVGAELARRRVGLPSVVFCTDATVHRMWVHEATDLFVTTCELAARSVLRYRPEANVAVVAPAVRASFFEVKDKEDSRRHFGVPAEGSCVLLVSGGWGIGPVARSAAALAERGHEVMAVSGWNRRLKRELDALEAAEPRVHSLGLTDEMPAAMAAADVVVSAPGQTCHEVRVVGRPLVVLDSVPGHGRENLLHETMSGGAAACSPTPESVVGAVGMVLKQGEVPPPWPVSSPDEWQQQFLGVLGRTGVSKLAYREGPEETGTSGP